MREIRLSAKEHERFLAAMEKKMTEKGISIDELAEVMNVKKQSIYNFRTDRSRDPSRFLAGKIATALDMKPGDWR